MCPHMNPLILIIKRLKESLRVEPMPTGKLSEGPERLNPSLDIQKRRHNEVLFALGRL